MVERKLFIGYSFLKEDKRIYEDFRRLLDDIAKDKNIRIITAEQPLPECPIEKVFPLIDQSDFCLILASKRDFRNEKGEYATSFWVYGEMTYALARHKPTMIFRENCVQLGGLPEFFTDIIPFNRKRIIEVALKLRGYIDACLEKLEKNSQHEDAYVMEEFIGRDTVFRNGFQIITAKFKVKVNSFVDNGLQIKHFFEMQKCSRKRVFLDDLSRLYNKKEIGERFKKQTFFFASKEENLGISFGKYKKGEGQDFFIRIPFDLQKKLKDENKCLTYEWGVSCPYMYPVSRNEIKEELLKSSLEEDVNSALVAIHNVNKIIFSVDFEKGYEFSKKPSLEIRDGSGNLKKENTPSLIHEERLYYNRYETEVSNCVKGEEYTIRWLPI